MWLSYKKAKLYSMRYLFFIILIFSLGPGLYAQSMKPSGSKIKRVLLDKKYIVETPSSEGQYMIRMVKKVSDLQHKTFRSPEELNRTLDFSLEDFKLPPLGYTMLKKANESRIKASKRLFKERVAWYRRERTNILASLDIHPAAYRVDYIPLINPSAKIIFLGERHYVANIRKQIEQLVLQYRKAHPHKKVYLLTEFLEMNYPDEPNYGFYRGVVLKGKKMSWTYLSVLLRLQQKGVKVLGLEPFRGLKELAQELRVPDPNFRRGSLSLIGQYIRNKSWANTIQAAVLQNPDAVFFVYTGFGHSSYKYLENLPFMLKSYPSQVFLFDILGDDTLNPAFADLFKEDFLFDNKTIAVTELKNAKYRRLLGADVLVYVHP